MTKREVMTVGVGVLLATAACAGPGISAVGPEETTPVAVVAVTQERITEVRMTDLTGVEWVAEDIAGEPVMDRVRSSLVFAEDGRLSGLAGCNRLSGSFSLSGDALEIGPLGLTRRGCPPAVMDQERRFVDALDGVERVELDERGWLLLYGPAADGSPDPAVTRLEPFPLEEPETGP